MSTNQPSPPPSKGGEEAVSITDQEAVPEAPGAPVDTETTEMPQAQPTGLVDDPFENEPENLGGTAELDDVEQYVSERTWRIKGMITRVAGNKYHEAEFDKEYVQKPLSYLAMMQFTGLLGRAIDAAMSGAEGLSIESLGDITNIASYATGGGPLTGGLFAQSDFAGVDAFVRGFAKVAAFVPEILAEAQCIWLRVPMRDRIEVIEIWSKPVDEGGLSNAEGEEMMRIFIQQNYRELEDFLLRRLRRIARTAAKERKKLHPDP